jgi:hypothetical protein
METSNKQTLLAAAIAGALIFPAMLLAQQAPASGDKTAAAKPATDLGTPEAPTADPWRFDFDVIGWGPSISGSTGVAGHQANTDVSLDTILGDLKGIAMLGFELRKEKFGFYAQPNWISLEANGNVGPLSAKDDLKIWIVDAAGFYQLGKWGQEKPVTLDALLGVRYWNVSDELTLKGPEGVINYHNSDSTYLIDPIIGLRTQIYLTRKFSLSLQGDVGGFGVSDHSSDLTWQALGTLGYDFTRHFKLDVGYRALSTDGPDGKNLDLLLHGLFLALDFHW